MLTGWAALWLDYNHDTWLDLYVCNGYVQTFLIPEGRRQPNQLYRNEGDSDFTNVTAQAGVGDRGTARGCATGDLDGDGDLDVVIVNSGREDLAQGRFAIQRNDRIGGRWVKVHLIGTDSNRDGIGAIVRLTIGEQTYMRHVSGGDGMLSSSQRDPHFGLADATRIDQLEVTWPSGTVDTVMDLPIDSTIAVVEGAGRLIGPAYPLPQ